MLSNLIYASAFLYDKYQEDERDMNKAKTIMHKHSAAVRTIRKYELYCLSNENK